MTQPSTTAAAAALLDAFLSAPGCEGTADLVRQMLESAARRQVEAAWARQQGRLALQ